MFWFALASLSPIVTLTAACWLGGVWPLIALAHVTVLVRVLDRIGPVTLPRRDDATAQRFGLTLNVTLGLLHLPLLALGVWALTQPDRAIWQTLCTALALALWFGQVSNSNAHELIHAPQRNARRLGTLVYITLLFGHHASAHPKVHHLHVASDGDPNSAPAGQGFYHFWPRAWIGSFLAGWRAETAARSRLLPPPAPLSHPYVAYCGGAALTLLTACLLAGLPGLAALIALAGYAQMQLLLADYVQHYGLRRTRGPDGKLCPAGPEHSWNAPHWYSSAMMLNAPRHSDHHQHPARRFPALELTDAMPRWPYPMPVMASLALMPPLWRRVMDPRLARLRRDGVE